MAYQQFGEPELSREEIMEYLQGLQNGSDELLLAYLAISPTEVESRRAAWGRFMQAFSRISDVEREFFKFLNPDGLEQE